MVVDQVREQADDLVFHALADPTRRDIVRRTMRASSSVSELARSYPMTITAVQKHVLVLERAHLVSKQRSGRMQLVTANLDTVRRARAALDQLESLWRDRVDRMGELLTESPDESTIPSNEGAPE